MTVLRFRLAPLLAAAALSSSAWAIQVEPDQPDLKNPKTRLVDSGRAAEASLNGGTTSISASSFTNFNAQVKRKPFPPGYGRSGYQFEDELTDPKTTPQPAPAAESDSAAQPADAPRPAKP